MERVVMLQIPEKTYALLEKEARGKGVEPAQMILEWVNQVVRQELANATSQPAKPSDTLRALFGTLKCDVVGVAENHDAYLAESLDEDLHSV
jgi:hypothetical protein